MLLVVASSDTLDTASDGGRMSLTAVIPARPDMNRQASHDVRRSQSARPLRMLDRFHVLDINNSEDRWELRCTAPSSSQATAFHSSSVRMRGRSDCA
jgi:hypothetical protein